MWFVSNRKYIMFIERKWPKTNLKRLYRDINVQNFNGAEKRRLFLQESHEVFI